MVLAKTPGPPLRLAKRWILVAIGCAVMLLWVYSTVPDEFPDAAWLRAIATACEVTLATNGDAQPVFGCGIDLAATDMPPLAEQVLVAAEDKRFFMHRGVDVRAMARAFASVFRRRLVEGGSTLEMQLAKNLLLSRRATLGRKLGQMILAVRLDQVMSKQEILVLYLNRADFGSVDGRPAIGIEQAARVYFHKRAWNLSLKETALLIGSLRNPNYYNVASHPDRALERARVVLREMADQGVISYAHMRAALDSRVRLGTESDGRYETRWVTEAVQNEIRALDLRLPNRAQVRAITSISGAAQFYAEHAVDNARARLGSAEVAIVALDARDGAVRAVVGGTAFTGGINRAIAMRRQPGSAFKPFVYASALDQGILAATGTVLDRPITIGGWTPRNDDGKYHGALSVDRAIATSSNVAAARTLRLAGVDHVIDMAQRCGIESKLRAEPSLALGTSEVTPLELTAAYAAFANNGRRVKPHLVTAVVSETGEILYRYRIQTAPAMRPATARTIAEALRAVIREGTGRRAAIGGAAAGKTGTTQDNADGWFVGFAGGLVAGVWVGNDRRTPVPGLYGGGLPATVWANFMTNDLRYDPDRS